MKRSMLLAVIYLCISVGWVEPSSDFVGFRYTLPNLHLASSIAKCETQQRPDSESSNQSFIFDQVGNSWIDAPLMGEYSPLKFPEFAVCKYRTSFT